MKTKYEDSLFYQIHVSDKFFRTLFEQLFKELNIGVSAIEHMALIAINETNDCCQRDLAKIILKDRAGTGKLAMTLENKGLIKIELKTKNNRPVRILNITEKGKNIIDKASKTIEPIRKKILKTMGKEKLEKTRIALCDFRETVKDIIKNKI